MNNKPVAWIDKNTGKPRMEGFIQTDHDIPLYTHPVKELKNIVLASATCSCGKVMEVTNLQPVKELTDEEITEIAKDCGYANAYHYNIRFAKAILKKAQDNG